MKDVKPKDLYKESGVDVAKGDRLVDWLQDSGASTTNFPYGQLVNSGGFAGLFRPQFGTMKDPLLVSGTDGVGTKVILGIEDHQTRGLGIDLVAMCVNDLYTLGARPLFFLDYFATSSLDETQFKEVLSGIRDGCALSQMALLGGETAEMPGLYKKGDFDLAGFVVGVVDGEQMLGAHRVVAGDKIYALPSNGFHSNGFSLVRKWLNECPSANDDRAKLLTPTRIYHELPGIVDTLGTGVVHALANITGGGFSGNLPRVLPNDIVAEIEWERVETPSWMRTFIEDRGAKTADMEAVFNLGVGMMALIAADGAQDFEACAKAKGLGVYQIGQLTEGSGKPSLRFK